jgi:hypothetical protein
MKAASIGTRVWYLVARWRDDGEDTLALMSPRASFAQLVVWRTPAAFPAPRKSGLAVDPLGRRPELAG